jgi:hypothetical protein
MKANIFKIPNNGEAALHGAPSSIIKAMEKLVRLAFTNSIKGGENWGEETI